MKTEYLGDSVYAEVEFGMIKLLADGMVIYLEPEVMERLITYYKAAFKK